MKYSISKNDIDFIIKNGKEFYEKLKKKNSRYKSLEKENSRYKSWEHCYAIFRQYHKKENLNDEDINYLCLHLAFYLASWGMYRGSSFLLERDYLIHEEVVTLIFNKEYSILWDLKMVDYEKKEIQDLREKLSKEIGDYYNDVRKEVNDEKDKKPTENDISNTLITKVLMGTIGCVPAYDRFFVKGLKQYDISPRIYGTNSITNLAKLYCENPEFEKFRKGIKININGEELEYPPMKILDMCFWQIGYDIDREERLNKS